MRSRGVSLGAFAVPFGVLSTHCEGSIEYFKKRELKSSTKEKKKKVGKSFAIWLQIEARICAKSIEMKKDRALEIAQNSLPDVIHKHSENSKRIKRAFKPLGSLISFISGLPSPSSWEKYAHLVDRIRQAVAGNLLESHSITTAIEDITNTTKLLSEEYELLTKKTWSLENKFDSFKSVDL